MKHPALYAAITAIISCVITAVICIGVCVHYTNEAVDKAVSTANENTRKSQLVWCALIITLDDAYHGTTEPTTPIGKQLAQNISSLRKSLGC